MTHHRDSDNKVRESNKQLRAYIKRLRKENDILRREIENIQKPARVRKDPVVPRAEVPEEPISAEKSGAQSKEEWRKDFVKKFKPKRRE